MFDDLMMFLSDELTLLSLSVCVQKQYGQILSKFRVMYTVGYSLSLAALTLALAILITFR